MPYTNDELYDLYRELPLDVRQAFGSIEYMKILDEVEKKHRLHLDQAAALSNEIYKLMLGITRPQAFIGAVKSAASVPQETAKEIATEVNEKIFRPVRESLMKIHKMKEMEEESIGNTSSEQSETKNDTKYEVEEKTPAKDESITLKDAAENKLTKPFTPPKKTATPDPYRESTI